MHQLPRISIVTPSFNQARFLEECLESVLSQGYPNLEYIVMDGGSTDGSVDIIRRYEGLITYWQSEPDGGHYQAVSSGFDRASGEIMAWLNADDKYCPLALFKVACLFADPRVSWITGRPLRWSIDGRAEDVCGEDIHFSRERVVVRKQFRSPWICQEATFWRRSLWERAGRGPRSDVRLAGDLELWVRFFRYAPLHSTDTLLGGNRRHPDQRSVLFIDEYLREAEVVLEEEANRSAPADSFDSPASLRVAHDDLKRVVTLAGLPPVVIAAEQVASDLLGEVLRLMRERHLHLEANQAAEKALLESEADRAARLQVIETLGARLAEVDADRQARLRDMQRLDEWLHDATARVRQLATELATAAAARQALEERIRMLERIAGGQRRETP